jgi:Transposase DDE domain group 1
MRVLVRRERPHPGAQISVFEAHDGWRRQAFATDTRHGQLAFLEARHRAHARVEDRIRTAKQAGLGRFPSREFAINAVWLQLALTAADLIARTQTILLTGELAKAEPKLLRYRLLHTAARIIRRGRRSFVKIAAGWPWADDLAAAFIRPSPASDNRCWPERQATCPSTTRGLGGPDTRPADQAALTAKINNTASRPVRP